MNSKLKALVGKITGKKEVAQPIVKKATPISPANAQYKKNMEGAYKSKYGSFK